MTPHDPITIERLDCQLKTQIMAIAIGSGCIILDFLRNFLFDHPVVEKPEDCIELTTLAHYMAS
jgi:hypothetical protein